MPPQQERSTTSENQIQASRHSKAIQLALQAVEWKWGYTGNIRYRSVDRFMLHRVRDMIHRVRDMLHARAGSIGYIEP